MTERTNPHLEAEAFGCIADHLPELESDGFSRSADEVRDRTIALFAITASFYGLPVQTALDWLSANDRVGSLTKDEAAGLHAGQLPSTLSGVAEALWILAWALEMVPAIGWACPCDDGFVHLFPDPRNVEGLSEFCSEPVLRSDFELLFELKLAYILHHCWVEHRLVGAEPPTSVDENTVRWRRHALEWLASDDDWDEITLDT